MRRASLLLAAGVLLLPASFVLLASPPVAEPLGPATTVALNHASVLQLTFEHNAEILFARERVNESEIALDAAMRSCMPEMLRKDTFKKPVAETTVYRRRVELRKTETDNLQDAANTYFDWLATVRGQQVAEDLLKLEEKLLSRARRIASIEKQKQVQALVKTVETAIEGRRQYILHTHQQSEALAAKLAYLMGMNGAVLNTTETLQPIDRIDTTVPVGVLVQQAQENGPGVRDMKGLIASIEQAINESCRAQRCCARTGAPLICGRLQMADSQLRQAQYSLVNLQLKLRAGVEEAFTAVLSGAEQLNLASNASGHAKEIHDIMDLLVTEYDVKKAMENKTYDGALNSIRQLSQAESNYLTAVNDYNKAQVRLMLLLGAFANCPANPPH